MSKLFHIVFRNLFVFVLLLAINITLGAQDKSGLSVSKLDQLRKSIRPPQAKEAPESHPAQVCGAPLSRDIASNLKRPVYHTRQFESTSDEVGDIKKFKAIDFTSESQETKEIVARAERKGTHAYIYVDTTQSFKESDLDEIISVFDDQIYEKNTQIFGPEPNPGIDGDIRITILFLEIEESADVVGDISGYFWSGNQFPKNQVSDSNEREMFYIDISRLARLGPDQTLGTVAHEFQHLIHWNHDRDEDTWINEGLSEYATFVNGLGISSRPSLFLNNTDMTLTGWDNRPRDYARAFLWILYVSDHYGGNALIRKIVANPNNGLPALHVNIAAFDPQISLSDILNNWFLANYLDGTATNSDLLEYPSIDLPPLRPTQAFGFLPVSARSASVRSYAADYYLFQGGQDLSLHFDAAEDVQNFRVKGVKLRKASVSDIIDFPLDSQNNGTLSFPDFGINFDQFVLVPYYLDDPGLRPQVNYTFSADGKGGPSTFSDTLQHHDTESNTVIVLGLPSPIINGSHFDAYAVRFTPPSDAILLGGEFSVWRREGQGGTVRFYVYEDSGDTLAIPAAKIDSVDVPNISGTPGTITWNSFDFSDKNIDIKKGQDFHLGWEFVDAGFGDTVFAMLDTARFSTNRSSVYVRENKQWSHFVSGLNFLMRAIIAVPADPTVPKVTAGLLQNPVFSQSVDIFTISETPLNPVSVEGTFTLGDSIRVLNFNALSDSNKVFIEDDVKLSTGGVGEIAVSARNKFGTVVGTDTLRLRVDFLEKSTGGEILSRDENLRITVPPKLLASSLFFTTISLKDDFHVNPISMLQNDLVHTGLGYTIGPPGIILNETVELQLYYGDNNLAQISENDLAIAFWEQDNWEILGGELYRRNKTISVLINRTGSYSLVVDRLENPVDDPEVPNRFYLNQNFPNPFNPNTTIKFGLPENTHVTLRIINLKGQIISTLIDAPLEQGVHEIEWTGSDDANVPVASGVYLYQLRAGDFLETKKLVLVK